MVEEEKSGHRASRESSSVSSLRSGSDLNAGSLQPEFVLYSRYEIDIGDLALEVHLVDETEEGVVLAQGRTVVRSGASDRI